jgi:hypothetical protein
VGISNFKDIMGTRIAYLLILLFALAGCTGEKTPPASPPAAGKGEKLPPEITGDPASALPKRKSPRQGP